MKKQNLLTTMLLLFALIVGSTSAWAADTFKKVTSISEIAEGNQYVLVCETENVAMKIYSSGTYCAHAAVTITNNMIVGVDDINVMTLEAGEDGWYFKQSDNKYLFSTGSKNLKADATNKTLCTITSDYQIKMGTNGNIQYNSSSPRFCPYTSSQKAAYLYIKDSSAPSITASDVNIDYDATGGSIDYTISNGVEGGELTAALTASSTWLTVGTVSSSAVAFTATENTGNARSATVRLTYTYNTNKTVTKDVIITQGKAPYSGPDYIRITSLDQLYDGAKVIITARYNNNATDYYAMPAQVSGKPEGVPFTSTTVSFGEVVDAQAAIFDDIDNYYWTVGITENGYTFTNYQSYVLGYSSGTDFTQGGDNTEWTITRATAGDAAMVAGYEGFYIQNSNISTRGIAMNSSHKFGGYATSNNNGGGYNFYLDIFVEVPSTVPCNVTDASGYRTFASDYITDWSDDTDGIAAYKAVVNGDNVTFEEVTGKVPAGTGLLIKVDAAGNYSIPTAATADNITSALVGVTENTTVNGAGIFVLYNGAQGVGFYKTTAASFTVSANTAYLPADVDPNNARTFIALDEDATGIAEIKANGIVENGKFYNLNGQQVAQPTKGLYIVNGKKVIMK